MCISRTLFLGVRAKKELYKYFREKYSELLTRYIHEAVRNASVGMKLFLKLEKKGLAYTEKQEVRK